MPTVEEEGKMEKMRGLTSESQPALLADVIAENWRC